MAIDQGTEAVPASVIYKSRRSWRTNIESGYGTVPEVTSYRQLVKKGEDGALTETPVDDTSDPVRFLFAEVAKQIFTLKDETTLTGAQIAEAISLVIDTKDQEQMQARLKNK